MNPTGAPQSCAPFIQLLSARIDSALDAARSGHLEEHLASCTSCRAWELSLRAQGGAVRTGAARRLAELEESGQIDLSQFASRVMRAIDADARRPSVWARLKLAVRERWQHERLAISASFGVAAAGCAALALLIAAPGHKVSAEAALLASQRGQASQASIENLELMNGTTGAVFEVPGQTTVIWLSDEAAE